MKRIVLLLTLALLCAALLAGCGCKHENVNEGNCETAKTCADCGEKLAEAPGHTWLDATCEAPKTCSACQKTEGQALGHTWEDATTEAPKTCATCQKTEGERIITDERFTTAACKDLFGTWELVIPVDGQMMELEGFEGVLDVSLTLHLSNDGKMTMATKVDKPEEFDATLKAYMMETIYVELEATGVKREDADDALKQSVGMTVEEYVDAMLKIIDFSAMFELLNMEGCYYVDGSKLYIGESWEDEMEPNTFSLSDGKLVIAELNEELGMADGAFTRAENQEG